MAEEYDTLRCKCTFTERYQNPNAWLQKYVRRWISSDIYCEFTN